MTSSTSEPIPYPWLDRQAVLDWLQLDDTDPDRAAGVELCRQAAAAYCADQRPDLVIVDDAGTMTAQPRMVMAALLAAARLWARRGSPAGLASFGEFGAAEVLRLDPDVSRLLGVGRHARPTIG